MKAISIQEPWISMIVHRLKPIETRTWITKHRGKLLLVGSAKPKGPYAGLAACVVTLKDIQPMTKEHEKDAQCEVYDRAKSWFLEDIKHIKPFPVKGQLGLYDVPDELIEYLEDDADAIGNN